DARVECHRAHVDAGEVGVQLLGAAVDVQRPRHGGVEGKGGGTGPVQQARADGVTDVDVGLVRPHRGQGCAEGSVQKVGQGVVGAHGELLQAVVEAEPGGVDGRPGHGDDDVLVAGAFGGGERDHECSLSVE